MKNERIKSIDALRGVAVLGMILADYPGSWDYMFSWREHAHWIGCTWIDLIFPLFLFLMGFVYPISIQNKLAIMPQKKLLLKIFKRTFLLFFFGILVNYFSLENLTDLTSLRLLGVLQRIAVIYFFSSLIFLFFNRKMQILISTAILIFYWGILKLIPVPEFGLSDLNIYPETITNLTVWVDKAILGNHVFQWTKPWDPEGILSTFPSLVNTTSGMIIGSYFFYGKNKIETKLLNIVCLAMIFLSVSYLWGFHFPIIKKIWTSSFSLFTIGWSYLLFVFFFWIYDYYKYNYLLNFFSVFGKNAILIFVSFGIIDAVFYKINGFIPDTHHLKGSLFHIFNFLNTPYFSSLLYTLLLIFIWFCFLNFINKKGIIIKL